MSGLDIWPGMVDAGSTIGLFEIGSLAETQDSADAAQFQPELRSSTALHPDSEHIPVTRANGILTSFVEPTGGMISGQGCLIDLNGWVPRELVIADQVALDVHDPDLHRPHARIAPARPGPGAAGPGTGQVLRERTRHASGGRNGSKRSRSCSARRSPTTRSSTRARERGDVPPAPDARLEALAPYARGEKPVILHAEQQVEILDALELARELKLKAVISGGVRGLEGGRCPQAGQGAGTGRRHAQAAQARLRSLRRRLRQPGEAARSRRDRRDPFQVGRLRRRDRRAQPSLRGRHGGRLRLARRRRAQGRHHHARRKSWASPTRSARSKPASAPTWSSRRATSSSRRRPYWPCSSTASRSAPRAATPSSTPSIAAGSTRSGPAGRGWESTRPRPSSPAPAPRARRTTQAERQ